MRRYILVVIGMLGLVAPALAQSQPAADPLAELTERVRRLEAGQTAPAPQAMTTTATPSATSADNIPRGTPPSASIPIATQGGNRPSILWTGQFQADVLRSSQNPLNRDEYGDIPDGAAFRRARIGVLGEYGLTEYRIEVDFAMRGRPSFLDVFGGVHDLPILGRVRAGHFFEPFSLERITSNRFVTFLERSLPDGPFAPARNLGVMAQNTWGSDQNGTWALGVFRSESDVFGDDVDEDGLDDARIAVTGRVTWLPYYDETTGSRYLHLGFAHSSRMTKNNSVQFRSQPEARLGAAEPNVPWFVDTGAIPADFFQLYGWEFALIEGPFSVQAEYVLTPVYTVAPLGGTALLQGGYVTMCYFLTGEHRPYVRDLGVFGRVMPKRDFVSVNGKETSFGPGAWEVALRVSHLDMNNGPVQGGQLTDFTVGLNWYLNPYFRVSSNYIHAAPAGRGSADLFAMRVGYDF